MNGRFLSEPFSGVQRTSTGYLRWLAANGAGPLLVCPAGARPAWWPGAVRESPLPPGRPGRLLWEQMALPLLAGRRRLLSLANTAPLAARDVVMVHDLAFLAHPEWFRPSFRRSYGAVTVGAARGARRVLVPSAFSAGEVRARLGVPAQRITVLAPGVDDLFGVPTGDQVAAVRARHGLPARFLLAVASLDPRKGLATAARAAASAGVDLVVAGARPASFSAVDLPGAVVRLGRVGDADLPGLYGAASALLYPSRYEGFGLPPLEAMACGTPVIASDLPVLRETLSGAAVLVDPDDSDGWVAAVRRVLWEHSAADELRAVGRERAARYTWARAGAALGEVLAAFPAAP